LPYQAEALLKFAAAGGASDLHITVGATPLVRVDGILTRAGDEKITPTESAALLDALMSPSQRERFATAGDIDFTYSIPGAGRFRVHGFRQRGSVGIVVRVLPSVIPTIEELGLPPVLATFTQARRGLVVVAGPSGSGRSTTLAALVDRINEERGLHILTLEAPIEYLHKHKRSLVNQREVGLDVPTFSAALRAALREDPDVIMLSELSDPDVVADVLVAAETRQLVLAGFYANTASHTIRKLIEQFPPHRQEPVRIQLSSTLVGVVAQQLVPRQDQPGRVVAVDILVASPAVRALIRDGRLAQLDAAIHSGGRYGMVGMADSLRALWDRGLISQDDLEARLMLLGETEQVTAAPVPQGPRPS